MKTSHVIKINTLGGIFTPLRLKSIIEVAYAHGTTQLNVGPRQELFFNIHKEQLSDFVAAIEKVNVSFEIDNDQYPNIVSSYPAEGILAEENWITEGIYKDIFDQFDYIPGVPINICDPSQHLIPVFSGYINVVASSKPHYWYIFINENEKLVRFPLWIYTTDVPKICKAIETVKKQYPQADLIEGMKKVLNQMSVLTHEMETDLQLPRYLFPYYEGLYKYNDKYWLGIYRRDYHFPIKFLYELCELCIKLHIAQICTTTWRTFIIKGIQSKDRIHFEKLLGKHSINLRHSANELNWIVNDINSDEPQIKKTVVSQLDKLDARTFGLVFGIKLKHAHSIPASVIIEQKPFFHRDEHTYFNLFDIYYRENFNPNGQTKILVAKNVALWQLTKYVIRISKKYYETLRETETTTIREEKVDDTREAPRRVYLCSVCSTVYDPLYGDPSQQIAPGTPFENLPESYVCSLCESPVSVFISVPDSDLKYQELLNEKKPEYR